MIGKLLRKGFLICVLFSAAILLCNGIPSAYAKVELTPIMQSDLGVKPLDVATTPDGKLVFVLTGDEMLVYATSEKKVTQRIRLKGGFDRIAYSVQTNLIILTSSAGKALKIIKVEPVVEIDISGHPFRGSVDAPVILAVFDDYQ